MKLCEFPIILGSLTHGLETTTSQSADFWVHRLLGCRCDADSNRSCHFVLRVRGKAHLEPMEFASVRASVDVSDMSAPRTDCLGPERCKHSLGPAFRHYSMNHRTRPLSVTVIGR